MDRDITIIFAYDMIGDEGQNVYESVGYPI